MPNSPPRPMLRKPSTRCHSVFGRVARWSRQTRNCFSSRAAIEPGERFVDEGRIAVQQLIDRLVLLNQMRDQPGRFLEHRFAQGGVVAGEGVGGNRILRQVIAITEPLAEELAGERLDFRVLHHAPHLRPQYRVVLQLSGTRLP